MLDHLDLEAEYNNRARVPEHAEMMARWKRASDRVRASAGPLSSLDVPYGDHDRQRYDLFRPDGATDETPLVVYLHGGYWQRGDRTDYACLAEPYLAAGCQFALPSYRLAPEAGVADIVTDIRHAIAAIAKAVQHRPVVVGHSAGGHLAVNALATDYAALDPELPPDLVLAAYAISGVYDLEPLIPTSINGALRLDASGAAAVNALALRPADPKSRLVAAVGGAESSELIRQSLVMAETWSNQGYTAECVVIPGANHFSVLDHLARPGDAAMTRVLDLAGWVSG